MQKKICFSISFLFSTTQNPKWWTNYGLSCFNGVGGEREERRQSISSMVVTIFKATHVFDRFECVGVCVCLSVWVFRSIGPRLQQWKCSIFYCYSCFCCWGVIIFPLLAICHGLGYSELSLSIDKPCLKFVCSIFHTKFGLKCLLKCSFRIGEKSRQQFQQQQQLQAYLS